MQNSSFIRPSELWRSLGLKADQTVVHLGAGAGFYIIPAAQIVGPKGKAIGIDIVPDMLAEIQNRAQRADVDNIVQVIRANLEQSPGSPLPDRSANWVLVANILHQADSNKIITEAARLITADGHIVVIEWDTAASPMGPPLNVRFPKQQVLELAQQHQLQLTQEFTPSPYHYGLLLTLTNS